VSLLFRFFAAYESSVAVFFRPSGRFFPKKRGFRPLIAAHAESAEKDATEK
jgi:hypothetical protein